MAKAKDPTERLATAVEQLSDDVNGLMQTIEEGTLLQQLVDEIRVLRSAIDDLRSEVEWAARNLFQDGEPRPMPESIRSMSRDPCDPAFASRLNAVSRHDLPADDEEAMMDDDAERVSEDADDAEEEFEEEETSETAADAEPPTPHPPPVEKSVASAHPGSGTKTNQSLLTRLYAQRHLEDIVRLIGHNEYPLEEFEQMVIPLVEKHGEGVIQAAIKETIRTDRRRKKAFVRLKPEVAKLAVQIVGRRKGES